MIEGATIPQQGKVRVPCANLLRTGFVICTISLTPYPWRLGRTQRGMSEAKAKHLAAHSPSNNRKRLASLGLVLCPPRLEEFEGRGPERWSETLAVSAVCSS